MMSPRTSARAGAACTAAVLAYATAVVMWYAVRSPLGVNHDEHQFMASAFMVARHGLHPYQDFAYFHMPNLVYLYTPFFLTPYPFLGARIFVGLCAAGIGLTTFLIARGLFADHGRLSRLAVPVAATALLVHSPVFFDASSRVWNHTPATLCALLAVLCHGRALRGDHPVRDFWLSGVCLGLAIGIRLSFAPLVVPFLVATVLFRAETARAKGWHALAFVAGGLLANAPAVYFLLTHFDDTVFGNLGYARLNTLYRQELSHRLAMTVAGKLVFLKERLFAQPGELPILVVAVYSLALVGLERLRSPARPRVEFLFLLGVVPFVFLGAMAPTPSWSHYYCAPVVFLLWLSLSALAQLRRAALSQAAALLLGVAALLSFLYAPLPRRLDAVVRDLVRPASWVPVRVQQEAAAVRAAVEARGGDGAVLTLSPLWAIEAGLPIYPAFVTGPFGYRVSHLLPEDEAAARGLPWGPGLQGFLEEHRPRALLTGLDEARVEQPLISAVEALGYRPIETTLGRVTGGRGQTAVIWVPPERSAPPETAGVMPR